MIIFRCNAGPQIGLGHLVRCRALAQVLKKQGVNCTMVGPDLSYQSDEDNYIFSDWLQNGTWLSAKEDAKWLVELAEQRKARMLVLDDYRINEEYQLVLKNHNLQWVHFSAPNQNLWGDFILYTSPAAKKEAYSQYLQNPETMLLLGPQYAILRPEFPPKNLRPSNRPVRKVLITFGGGDDRGAIRFVLETLLLKNECKSISFLVISGKSNPRNHELSYWIGKNGKDRVVFKINPPNIAQLFAECDLAVMGGGTTTYEAACCGLPMILLAISDNQIPQSIGWDCKGAANYLGMFKEVKSSILLDNFLFLIKSESVRTSMIQNCKLLVNVDGKNKLVSLIKEKI